jgi:pilus assembly protein CpaF
MSSRPMSTRTFNRSQLDSKVGRLFSVYCSKGGVGKTYLAVNLASTLFRETGERVLLLDFSLPYSSDLGQFLNTPDMGSFARLLPKIKVIDSKILASYPTKTTSGLYVLSLVANENDLQDLEGQEIPTAIVKILEQLRTCFPFLIVDLRVANSRLADAVLNLSDRIVLPFLGEPLSLLTLVRDLKHLQHKNYSHYILHPVYNKAERSATISVSQAESRIQRKLSGVIPLNKDADGDFAAGRLLPLEAPLHPLAQAFTRLALNLLQATIGTAPETMTLKGEPYSREALDEESIVALKNAIHTELLIALDLKNLDVLNTNDPEKLQALETKVKNKISEIVDRKITTTTRSYRERLVREIFQEALKLGPLEDLLADPDIDEIMVVRWNQLYVERKGCLELVPQKFLSEEQLRGILERVVAPLGRRIDLASPMVDARLKDGSRVNAVIPPLAVKGANLTIRKFGRDTVGIKELIEFGSLNEQLAGFLEAAVKCRLNIIVSGGTGSGKTTLLNILSSFIPEDERIITIEDSAELQLRQPHVITLESRPVNIEGSGEITIRDLVRNSLRMRPDRIVVGECRAGEALDMLQAMNTGHDGSLTTLHANSTREALSRLETLVMFAGFKLPVKAIREQIVGAISIIVQLSRLKDGSRKVLQVSEVIGMDEDLIALGDIYLFEQDSQDRDGRVMGNFVATGYTPKCLAVFAERGAQIPKESFWKTT